MVVWTKPGEMARLLEAVKVLGYLKYISSKRSLEVRLRNTLESHDPDEIGEAIRVLCDFADKFYSMPIAVDVKQHEQPLTTIEGPK